MSDKKKDSKDKVIINKKTFDKNISSEEKILHTLIKIFSYNLLILVILFLLILHYKALSSDLVAKVLSSLIAVIGVFAGFFFNKKQTYKEIVTKERINWLHKMQENLSEYLKLTKSILEKDIEKIVNEKEKEKAKLLIEEKKDKINKLYYEIIFNINHENDNVAYNAIKKYNSLVLGELEKIRVNLAIKEGVKLELVAVAGEEGELLFKIKDKSERKKLIDLIKKEELKNILIAEDKDKNKNKDEKELPKEISLLRKEVSEEFTKIFNETWNRIKEEAD